VSAAPLTLAELAATLDAIGGFEARPLIAVAVSGGPDSMALTLLADRWARQHGGTAWGLTVDHGLRPESADEARTVARWLAGRGIPHRTLQWLGDKPRSAIQERARNARYRLLAEWCRANGCLHLLTAHHREDQAETYLMRKRAGSGIDGLAGMSAVRELPGCRLVRPLLAVSRLRLAALLAAENQPSLEDPSNRNPIFERARLRRAGESLVVGEAARCLIPAPPPDSKDGADWEAGELRRCAGRRIAREHVLDALIGRVVALHPAGFAAIDAAALAAADDETAERLLGRVAACVGGARYPARRARLAQLRQGLSTVPATPRTLGGCRFVPWRGRILVLRELAAASEPAPLQPEAGVLWDNRFLVSPVAPRAYGLVIGHLGQWPGSLPERGDRVLPRLVHVVLPALWDAAGLSAVPHLGFFRDPAAALPGLSFRPVNPLTHAGFTVV
jgi:tRNA(Ile)-lysidine synthase